MSDQEKFTPPELKSELPISLTTGLIFMFVVMLLLPLSQWIDALATRRERPPEILVVRPPEQVQEIRPPEEEQEEEEIEEMEVERQLPTLQQLELSMNTDLSGLGSSDFTVPTFDFSSEIGEVIFELKDLTRQPRPLSQRPPIYPPELQRARIEGEVTLQFVVNPDGSTSNIIVENSSNPAFEEPTIRAVRAWRFEPGEKDGKKVRARVRIKIPFTIN